MSYMNKLTCSQVEIGRDARRKRERNMLAWIENQPRNMEFGEIRTRCAVDVKFFVRMIAFIDFNNKIHFLRCSCVLWFIWVVEVVLLYKISVMNTKLSVVLYKMNVIVEIYCTGIYLFQVVAYSFLERDGGWGIAFLNLALAILLGEEKLLWIRICMNCFWKFFFGLERYRFGMWKCFSE